MIPWQTIFHRLFFFFSNRKTFLIEETTSLRVTFVFFRSYKCFIISFDNFVRSFGAFLKFQGKPEIKDGYLRSPLIRNNDVISTSYDIITPHSRVRKEIKKPGLDRINTPLPMLIKGSFMLEKDYFVTYLRSFCS